MGRLLNRKLNQTVVYWAPKSIDEFGQRTFESPIEVTCRCEEGQFLSVDSQGKEFSARFQLLSSIELQREGWIYTGTLAEAGNTSPQELGGAEIVQVSSAKNVKGSDTVYTILAGK
jgi:hypothetical protein